MLNRILKKNLKKKQTERESERGEREREREIALFILCEMYIPKPLTTLLFLIKTRFQRLHSTFLSTKLMALPPVTKALRILDVVLIINDESVPNSEEQ